MQLDQLNIVAALVHKNEESLRELRSLANRLREQNRAYNHVAKSQLPPSVTTTTETRQAPPSKGIERKEAGSALHVDAR